MGDTGGSPQRLGLELASARQGVRRSLRDVAGEAGISAAYLQKLETGRVEEPSPRILHRLGSVLKLDYRKLMVLAGYDMPAGRTNRTPPTGRLATSDLTEAEERAVAAFIDHLVGQRPEGS